MAKTRSDSPAPAELTTSVTRPLPHYEVVGLQPVAQIIIKFDGREYDLASLSDDELDYLLQFPQQVPYLNRINQ